MIIQQVNQYDFINAFTNSQYKDNFTRPALFALYDYLDNLSDDIGEPLTLDIVAIACDYTEYADLAEIREAYSMTKIDSIEDLENYTQVIQFDGGIIIQNF